jgi:hypothetical protein
LIGPEAFVRLLLGKSATIVLFFQAVVRRC